jgi:glycosyltransferase involved in cell wall biosynthesis
MREGAQGPVRARVAFVTNFCAHYRVRTFEILAQHYSVAYYFFSAGKEWYWQQQHGTQRGNFRHEYLPGFQIAGTRLTPTLPWKLMAGGYDVYIKCINGRFALPATYLAARLRRRPFILWTGIWMTLKTPLHRAIFPVTRYIYRHSDAVVTYGEHVKRYLVDQGVAAEKIFPARHAVDNGLYSRQVSDEEKATLRQRLNLGPADRVLLYLGRLEIVKGVAYLIRAFHELDRAGVKLVLAGDGSERNSLERLAKELGILNQVRFVGYVEPANAAPYYALAEALVLPSITVPSGKETWGLVVNEAMNQGVPVIATDAVGAAAGGLVQDGVNGFIVPERDSDALASALRRILDDPALRQRMSRNAREIVAGWDNEQMVLGFRNAVEYVLRRRS